MNSYVPKLFALTSVALFALLAVAQPAAATSVTGTIVAPTVNAPGVGLVTRDARCAYLLGGEATNGAVGWALPLSAANSGATFSLSATGAGVAIVFYSSLGTCDGVTGPGPKSLGTFEFLGGSGSGTVPAGATFAIIVIENGVNAPFTFSA